MTQGSLADRHRDHATPSTDSLCFPAGRPALPASSPRTPSWRGSLETPFSKGAGPFVSRGLVWSPRIWPLDFYPTPLEGETPAGQPLRTPASRAQRPEPRPAPRGAESASPGSQPRTHRLRRCRLPGAASARRRHRPGPASDTIRALAIGLPGEGRGSALHPGVRLATCAVARGLQPPGAPPPELRQASGLRGARGLVIPTASQPSTHPGPGDARGSSQLLAVAPELMPARTRGAAA